MKFLAYLFVALATITTLLVALKESRAADADLRSTPLLTTHDPDSRRGTTKSGQIEQCHFAVFFKDYSFAAGTIYRSPGILEDPNTNLLDGSLRMEYGDDKNPDIHGVAYLDKGDGLKWHIGDQKGKRISIIGYPQDRLPNELLKNVFGQYPSKYIIDKCTRVEPSEARQLFKFSTDVGRAPPATEPGGQNR